MLRAESQVPLAARHHEADVTILEFIAADRLEQGLGHLLAVDRDHHADRGSRLVETLDMLLQAEDLAAVKADPLENSVSVEKAVIKDRNLRLGLGIKSAVDIDLHRHFSMRPENAPDKKLGFKHRLNLALVGLSDHMAAELEGHGQLVTDLKRLSQEFDRSDALEWLEPRCRPCQPPDLSGN